VLLALGVVRPKTAALAAPVVAAKIAAPARIAAAQRRPFLPVHRELSSLPLDAS
jgi:hypothetical protein